MSREAGRELDAEVAAFMGWTNIRPLDCPHYPREYLGDAPPEYIKDALSESGRGHVPYYSVSIGWAWQVVEKLRGLRFLVEVREMPVGLRHLCRDADADVSRPVYRKAMCELNYMTLAVYSEPKELMGWRFEAVADTAPHAICLAALQLADAIRKEQARQDMQTTTQQQSIAGAVQ